MRDYSALNPDIKSLFAILLPVILWALLFIGLGGDKSSGIWNPEGPLPFVNGIRSILPFVVGGSVAVFLVFRVLRGYMPINRVIGPLGLSSSYGMIGFISAFNSPDGTVALWWTGLYLSVPVVLWGIVWKPDPLEQLRPLINATWLAIISAAAVLLVIAIFKLDLVDRIQNPSLLLECRAADWFDLTSGRIRGTGVGRYAAITALIAISGVWVPKWRKIWFVLLVISLIFLLYTSARGSFAGFGVGASLILIIYTVSTGKKAMVIALVTIAIAVPLIWGTGLLNHFWENCITRNVSLLPTSPFAIPLDLFPGPTPEKQPAVVVPEPTPEKSVSGIETKVPTSSVATPSVLVTGPTPEEPVPGIENAPSVPATVTIRPGTDTPTTASKKHIESEAELVIESEAELVEGFYSFSGRQAVWSDGWGLFKDSPIFGYGFHADRLLLGTHMHNSIMHAMLQTGLLGTIPFVLAIVLAWILILRLIIRLKLLIASDKHMVIQCAGVLAFFTMRSFPESTGAFFGVDWLIIAVILFYLQKVNTGYQQLQDGASSSKQIPVSTSTDINGNRQAN